MRHDQIASGGFRFVDYDLRSYIYRQKHSGTFIGLVADDESGSCHTPPAAREEQTILWLQLYL